MTLQPHMMDVDMQRKLAGMQFVICKCNLLPSTVKLVSYTDNSHLASILQSLVY